MISAASFSRTAADATVSRMGAGDFASDCPLFLASGAALGVRPGGMPASRPVDAVAPALTEFCALERLDAAELLPPAPWPFVLGGLPGSTAPLALAISKSGASRSSSPAMPASVNRA